MPGALRMPTSTNKVGLLDVVKLVLRVRDTLRVRTSAWGIRVGLPDLVKLV